MWKVGDVLRHRFNRGIGPGRVTSALGRSIEVHFPGTGETLRFAAESDAIVPFEFPAGLAARLSPGDETVRIAAREKDRYRLEDGRLVEARDLWPLDTLDAPIARLAAGDVDPFEAFANRLDARHLASLREADGLGSFLGGRIRIFPHQLYVAERASWSDPVRWLLADEVGLGKTVEACLILNRLARTGRAERILIVAPASLTVQWLGELYRKFHHVLSLLDDKRLDDARLEFGPEFNPFDAHPRAIIALERLAAEPSLANLAAASGYDLLIVDEAHRLERSAGLRLRRAERTGVVHAPGAEGSPAYRAALPLVRATPNVLLLTGTPLESDARGFFHLLQLLRPEEFPEDIDVESRLASGVPLPPCTSATRRVDIGGLPPRVPVPIELEDASRQARGDADAGERPSEGPNSGGGATASPAWRTGGAGECGGASGSAIRGTGSGESGGQSASADRSAHATSGAGTASGWEDLLALEERVARGPQDTGPDKRRKLERFRRAVASPAALAAVLGAGETLAREEAARAEQTDPRAAWLAKQAPLWRKAGEKTLVFVAHAETLFWLKKTLERSNSQRVGVFHEELSPERADIEVAQFRLPAGPGLLIATECGGEGRNFQFCRRLVLFDLPWNPVAVEQRIGRLDRIDRTAPVEVVYFRPPAGLGALVTRFYEKLGIFEEPLAGLEGALEGFEVAIEEAALESAESWRDERQLAGPPRDAARARGRADHGSRVALPPGFDAVLGQAREARTRIQQAAYHELHRDPYRAEMAEAILGRIPEDLEETNAEVVLAACEEFGFRVIPQRGRQVYAIEFGNSASVEHLPGVPAGSNFLGTFDREEAVERETIDFFAAGHALVEGVLSELEDGPRGRVALLQIAVPAAASTESTGEGLLALYTAPQGRTVAIALDQEGRERPEWARLLLARPIRSQRIKPETWIEEPGWADKIRALAEKLPSKESPFAVAAFRIVRTVR